MKTVPIDEGPTAEEVSLMPAEDSGAGAGQGLAWSWELDFDALVAGLAEADLGEPHVGEAADPDCQGAPDGAGCLGEADNADGAGGPGGLGEAAGRGGERLPTGMLAGRVAERVAPGPGLAALLCQAPAADLGDFDLAASAGSWRRLASWAQARELAAVAQIASRTAARDKDTGVAEDGRPARVPASAAAEVALELTMSRYSAAAWADLAVDLGWRLAATGAALAAGTIDLQRARLIAEATAVLDDGAARAVQAAVLPAAGKQTTGMLRAALRRAVILADPAGAERRRQDAERQARVVLYPDQDTTATLAGVRLPGIHAAAAMARITALARAWKAAGAPGPADLLRAKIYLGLLLGTQPQIPPADGAPPDDDPGGDPGHDDGPGDPFDPADPGDSGHGGHGGSPRRGGPGNDGHARGTSPAEAERTTHGTAARATCRVKTCRTKTCRTKTCRTKTCRATACPVITCRRLEIKMLPATTRTIRALMTSRPETTRTARTTAMKAALAAVRSNRGRACPRSSRPRRPAPPGAARRRGCWTCRCPGRSSPGPARHRDTWAGSGPSPAPRPAAWPDAPPLTPLPNGGSSSPTPPGTPLPSPASPGSATGRRHPSPAALVLAWAQGPGHGPVTASGWFPGLP